MLSNILQIDFHIEWNGLAGSLELLYTYEYMCTCAASGNENIPYIYTQDMHIDDLRYSGITYVHCKMCFTASTLTAFKGSCQLVDLSQFVKTWHT